MNNATTTALVERTNNMTALQLCGNMQSVTALGQMLAQSGFFGQVSASTATAALVNCFLEGLTPLQYKAKYHTFDNGQTGVKSDFIQREFHRLGGKWKFNEWSGEVCDMTFTYQGETLPFRVTLEEFKKNGVAMSGKSLKANWEKFPREMLKARCMSTAIRALCPEALDGMYTQEEVADFTTKNAPIECQQVEVIDASVCPCGSVKGKPWADIDTDVLLKILDTPRDKAQAITDAHVSAIRAELEARGVIDAIIEAEISDGDNAENNDEN